MFSILGHEFADAGYFINLAHRTDRLEKVLEQVEKYKIKGLTRFEGIISGEYAGCGMSHVEIIKEAKAKGYRSVAIFEDDFYIMPKLIKGLNDQTEINFEDTWRSVAHSLQALDYWDAFYFGGRLSAPTYLTSAMHLVKLTEKCFCAHALIIRDTLYDTIINEWSYAKEDQIDHYYGVKLQKRFEFLLAAPMLINHGDAGANFSDLLKRDMSYHNWLLDSYDEFVYNT
jgi:hypothetical protein